MTWEVSSSSHCLATETQHLKPLHGSRQQKDSEPGHCVTLAAINGVILSGPYKRHMIQVFLFASCKSGLDSFWSFSNLHHSHARCPLILVFLLAICSCSISSLSQSSHFFLPATPCQVTENPPTSIYCPVRDFSLLLTS